MGASQDDMSAAWPIASMSFVEPEIGIKLVYGRKLSEAKDPEAEKKRLIEQWGVVSAPWGAAQVNPLEIIDPRDTRKWIHEVLTMLRGKRGNFIGKHRLATWPAGF